MNAPKPQPPKSVLKPILSGPIEVGTETEIKPAAKKPFVLRPHLTDRPFSELKEQLKVRTSATYGK